MEEFEFKAINQSLMSCVNFLIINNKIADVNDEQWKTIKNLMSDICGIDLSTGFIVKDNIYDVIKNIIYPKNNNNYYKSDDTLIKNEIFGTINLLLTARDDCILLILNLLIYCIISFYKEINQNDLNIVNQKNDKNNEEKKIDNKEQKLIDINEIENNNINNISNNNIINNINNENNSPNNFNTNINKNNINIINDDIIDKIQDELFDDEEKNDNINPQKKFNDKTEININLENYKYNTLDNDFFKLDLTNQNNLFSLLLKLFLIPRNLRSITNDIILYNISILLTLNKNHNKEIYIQKVKGILKNEIDKLRNFLKKDKSLKKYTYITSINAHEQYIKPKDNKIKDLISSPFILIPIIYLDEQDDVPQNFKEIKYKHQLLSVYIMNILILYDILNDLYDCQYDIISETKKNPFQLPKQVDFVVGKEYSKLDLGKEHILCELIINNKIIKAVIFFDFQNVYFCQIMSNSYKNLSKIKLVKKYNLRNIEIKIPNSNESIEHENTLF